MYYTSWNGHLGGIGHRMNKNCAVLSCFSRICGIQKHFCGWKRGRKILGYFWKYQKFQYFNVHYIPYLLFCENFFCIWHDCVIAVLSNIRVPSVLWMPSVLWHCWLGGRKDIRPVKNWVVRCWRGYLSGARCGLAYAQLMPLPLAVSCFSKIQIGFTLLVPAHPGSPGKRAVKRVCVCVCVCVCLSVCLSV